MYISLQATTRSSRQTTNYSKPLKQLTDCDLTLSIGQLWDDAAGSDADGSSTISEEVAAPSRDEAFVSSADDHFAAAAAKKESNMLTTDLNLDLTISSSWLS